ncbi:MAG: hypothetical protein LBI63_02205 [Candidatus Ancillula sp.]|jgi:hypothetical protein|nr:hypothetical protein [Candidatus Ancillula sp.]
MVGKIRDTSSTESLNVMLKMFGKLPPLTIVSLRKPVVQRNLDKLGA